MHVFATLLYPQENFPYDTLPFTNGREWTCIMVRMQLWTLIMQSPYKNWSIFRHAPSQPCDDELESIIFLHSYFLSSFWLHDGKWNRCHAIWNRFCYLININWISVIHKLRLWVYFPWSTLLGAFTIGYTKRMSHWKITLNFNCAKT